MQTDNYRTSGGCHSVTFAFSWILRGRPQRRALPGGSLKRGVRPPLKLTGGTLYTVRGAAAPPSRIVLTLKLSQIVRARCENLQARIIS